MTFDHAFDEWDRQIEAFVLERGYLNIGALRAFLAAVRSEMDSRQRAIDRGEVLSREVKRLTGERDEAVTRLRHVEADAEQGLFHSKYDDEFCKEIVAMRQEVEQLRAWKAGATPRASIYTAVDNRRIAQDRKFGTIADNPHTPIEWLALINEELGEVRKEANQLHWPPAPQVGFDLKTWTRIQRRCLRNELLDLIATACAAVEQLDAEGD